MEPAHGVSEGKDISGKTQEVKWWEPSAGFEGHPGELDGCYFL